MKTISWKASAEFIGVTAIIASLIFVGLQLRQEQRFASIEAGFSLVESFYEQRNGSIENAAIWTKGNAGVEELSATEVVIYDALIHKEWSHAYWASHAWRELGNEENIGIHDFAGFLHRNPGARRTWENLMAIEQKYRSFLIPVPVDVDMINIVFSDLEKLNQIDPL